MLFMFLVNIFLEIPCRGFDGRLGTIRHAQLAAIAHNREVIARYRALAKNPGMVLIFDGTPWHA